jgi:hypothetical protein
MQMLHTRTAVNIVVFVWLLVVVLLIKIYDYKNKSLKYWISRYHDVQKPRHDIENENQPRIIWRKWILQPFHRGDTKQSRLESTTEITQNKHVKVLHYFVDDIYKLILLMF